MKQLTTINVYLIARISQDVHEWNRKVCAVFAKPFTVFLPQEHNPWNIAHETIPQEVYAADIHAMEQAHIGLLLPEYGSDCAFEVGWFAKARKPVVVLVDTQKEWLRDWMVKGGVNTVVTCNRETYRIMALDPILQYKKVVYIRVLKELPEVLYGVYQEKYAHGKTISIQP